MTSAKRVLALVEVQKNARPGLADARLVELARDKSLAPRVVLQRAQGFGVSRRQAEGARWLAIIRRDFGLEALDQFISSMARARADLSVTEQAHRGEFMSDRTLKSVLALTDVRKKFGLLLKNGYAKEAADFLLELAENGTAFCWLNVAGGRIVNNPLGDEFRDGKTGSLIADVVLVFRRDMKNGFNPSGNEELAIWLVSLVPMLEKAGLEDCRNRVFQIVKTVLKNTVKQEPRGFEGSPASYWNVLGTTLTKREIWPDNQPIRPDEQESLARQVEIWQARYHFFGGDTREMQRTVLPAQCKVKPELDPARWFDWLVDYLQECGWTIQQVRQEFTEWLERRGGHGLHPQIVIAVAASKCFQGGDANAGQNALHKHLVYFWQQLCREGGNDVTLETFLTLGVLGLFGNGDTEFFRIELTDLMADGRVPFVMMVVRDLGVAVGLRSRDLGPSGSIKVAVMGVLNSLAPAAFNQAMFREKFGVAAALGQCFNCVDETQLRLKANRHFRDQLIEVVNWDGTPGLEDAREKLLLEVLDGKCEKSALTDDGDLDLREDGYKWRLFWPGDTRGKEVSEAVAQKFFALRDERDELLKTLIEIRKTEIKEAVETALALEMPIAFDVVTLL